MNYPNIEGNYNEMAAALCQNSAANYPNIEGYLYPEMGWFAVFYTYRGEVAVFSEYRYREMREFVREWGVLFWEESYIRFDWYDEESWWMVCK